MNEDDPEYPTLKQQVWGIASPARPALTAPGPEEQEPDLFQMSTGGGYEKWKEEQAAERLCLQKQSGVPLGKQVRVQLRGESCERVGLLLAATERKGRSKSTTPGSIRLRIGDHFFFSSEIESVVRLF
jgi:hypothetical protein